MSPFEQADFALGQGGKYWKKNYTGLGGGGGGKLCPILYTLLYTISDRKGTPFIHLLLINGTFYLFYLFCLTKCTK